MNKLSRQEEKELVSFIKGWLKSHGFTQKELANELNIKSSRTSETVSYTHLRAHETEADLVCRLLLEKKIFKFLLKG